MVLSASELEGMLTALPRSPPHFSGFTTYLRTVLMRGIRYRAPPQALGTKTKGRQRGLVLGRRLDTAFRRFAETGVSGSLTGVVASVLRRRGISIVGTQPTVFDPRLRVKTAVDGVGLDRNGTVWILELKNTQHSLSEHRSLYDSPCTGNEYLTNGLRNTERVRHALQAGFGALGFRRAFPTCSVRALVVVNCTDGAVGYSVDCAEYASPSIFPPNNVGLLNGGVWDPRNAELRRLVSRLGFDTSTHRRACSGTVGLYLQKPKLSKPKLAIGIGTTTRRALLRQKADVRAVVITRGRTLVAERI